MEMKIFIYLPSQIHCKQILEKLKRRKVINYTNNVSKCNNLYSYK